MIDRAHTDESDAATLAEGVAAAENRSPTRREALAAFASCAAALMGGCAGTARAAQPESSPGSSAPPALPGNHSPSALPFAPGSLRGLSERLIVSHHENNYGGAVKNLNRVELELSRIDAETPAFIVAGLRERELTFRNSKSLHEAYFGNLGGTGQRSGPIEQALAQAYGSSARWEEHMRATAMALGGGSGWAILGLELDTGALRTIGSAHHTQVLGSSLPLLVLDMYEHSYHLDYGASVARYIDAFFANVSWDEVNRRLERAQRASAAVRAAGG